MTFKQWILSTYPNPNAPGDGVFGPLHIITLVLCAAMVIISTILFRKRSEKAKRIFLFTLAMIILVFGIIRRITGFINKELTFNNIMYILLPRPGCAISCVLVILASIFNKKAWYNIASIVSLICAIIFFAYPGAGFINKYILFEQLYSIVTHSLFFVMSILFMTLGLTEFRYKTCWKEAIAFVIIIIYSFLEIYVLKINADPFYFMPNNEVQEIVGMGYAVYLALYMLFMFVYVNLFYLIGDRKAIFKRKK